MIQQLLSSFPEENLLNTITGNWVLEVMKQKPGRCSSTFYRPHRTRLISELHTSIPMEVNPTGIKTRHMIPSGN